MQKGPCAFSNACSTPGPRHRLAGTNLTYCEHHWQAVQASAATEGRESGALVTLRQGGNRRRSSWALYVGIATS